MRTTEIIEIIAKENPGLLGNVPQKRAIALIREVFIQLAKKIEEQDEGIIKVPGLGSFRIKMVETEKENQVVSAKRIFFRPAKPTPGKSAKGETEKSPD